MYASSRFASRLACLGDGQDRRLKVDAVGDETHAVGKAGRVVAVDLKAHSDGLLAHLSVREVHLPIDQISGVSLNTRWLKTQLTIQVRDLQLVSDFPGAKLGQIRLRFRRRFREPAAQLAVLIEDRLEELRLDWDGDDQTARLGY